MSAEAQLNVGRAALDGGDWAGAREAFEASLRLEESAEALAGLGSALWWLEQPEASLRCRERAYAAFRRRPDPAQAALVALQLVPHYGASLGNMSAAAGWTARAARLVEEFDLAPLRGWVLLCRAAVAADRGDPETALALAADAGVLARRSGDADLELCAMSEQGGALVLLGRVGEGSALLDEAMAAALGGEAGPDTVVYASCKTVVACSLAAELKRASDWIRAADEFNRRHGSTHLYALCRTHHGAVLLATGRWVEAEQELLAALSVSAAAEPALHAEALAGLAGLRLAQGRTEEAARLLDGLSDHPRAALVLAAVRLRRNDFDGAAALLERRLRSIGDGSPGRAGLLDLAVELELARGEATPAARYADTLAALAERLGADPVTGQAERAQGRVSAAAGAVNRAVPQLERALAAFARSGLPLEAARTRIALAAVLAASRPEAAAGEGRLALEAFESLGADADADAAAAFLRGLGRPAARSGPRGAGVLTRREQDILALLGEGLSNAAIAARLVLSRKTVENHVANVLAKLGLSGRAEAAAYVARHPPR